MRNKPAGHSLTEEQQRAFDKIESIVTGGSGVATLSGYAGTGKTTTLRQIARRLGPEFSEVYMMAPTHKAAEVLGRKTGREVSTIHSALGLRPKRDGQGGYKFVPTGQGRRNFAWGSLLLVDEGSMVPQQLYDIADDIRDNRNLSIVYSGDPAQLPPVNETPSPALDHDGYKLEKIVRQEQDNPIIQASMEVREAEDAKRHSFTPNVKGDQGVEVAPSRTELIEKAIEAFDTDLYRRRGDHVRILAYRNDVVETYNEICRDILYDGTDEQFIDGEWLVATDPWYGSEGKEMAPIIQNSEEFVVQGKEPSSLYGFDTWVLEISSDPDGGDEVRYIEVLNRDEIDRYEAKLNDLAEKAKQNGNWDDYYNYKEHFAHVDYSYAMTTHKAQGSTFTKTFVDAEDISTCPNRSEISRLKYVATTRASQKLVVFE
jgi:exodeoxyribonuclease-5